MKKFYNFGTKGVFLECVSFHFKRNEFAPKKAMSFLQDFASHTHIKKGKKENG